MGPIAAQWFSDFLGRKAHLVRFDPEHKRVCNTEWTGGLEALNQFSDGYSLLVLSEASLAQFNEKLVAAGAAPVGMLDLMTIILVFMKSSSMSAVTSSPAGWSGSIAWTTASPSTACFCRPPR